MRRKVPPAQTAKINTLAQSLVGTIARNLQNDGLDIDTTLIDEVEVSDENGAPMNLRVSIKVELGPTGNTR
jgi:hypothetical protein